MMDISNPAPENVQVKYTRAPVLQHAAPDSQQVAELHRGDSITIVGVEGDFYKVRLSESVIKYC